MIFSFIVGTVVLLSILFWLVLIIYSKVNNELDEVLKNIEDDDEYTPL